MKHKFLFPFLTVLAVLLFAGCKKIFEHIPKPDKPENGSTECRIKKITGAWDGYEHTNPDVEYDSMPILTGTLLFHYDASGNPTSITAEDTIVTTNIVGEAYLSAGGYPYRLFRYNNNRLTDLIIPVNPNLSMDRGYRRWHRYVYDNANKIIADTVYSEGYEVNGRPSSTTYSITTFTYDAQNRILPPTSFILELNPAAHYDSSGNYLFLGPNAAPSYYPYDYQTNFLRTNKIWMFLGMNYSVNEFSFIDPIDRNYPAFSSWNDCKLPTYFNNNQLSYYPNFFTNSFFTKFFDISWKEMHIEYESCDCTTNTGAKM